jgi:hypothetical protein
VEYLAHVKHLNDLEEGKTMVMTIRDLSPGKQKYLARVARVKVSRSPDALKSWDTLWAHSVVGYKDTQPWGMKIVEELGETVPGKPYSDIYEALARM